MNPKTIILIFLSIIFCGAITIFSVYQIEKQKQASFIDNQASQKIVPVAQDADKEETLEEKRLKMLELLNQNQKDSNLSPEEIEAKRLEMLKALNSEKSETKNLSKEETEQKRLEMLKVLNENN